MCTVCRSHARTRKKIAWGSAMHQNSPVDSYICYNVLQEVRNTLVLKQKIQSHFTEGSVNISGRVLS